MKLTEPPASEHTKSNAVLFKNPLFMDRYPEMLFDGIDHYVPRVKGIDLTLISPKGSFIIDRAVH